MRKSLILLILLSAPALSVTMYRWVDENGVVHYSDVPQAGGGDQVIDVPPAQGYEPAPLYRALTKSSDTAATNQATPDANVYSSLTIDSPTEEQVLWNIGGTLNVSLSVSPALRSGDSIELYYDSQNVAAPGSRRTSYVVNDVFRGTHSLRAAIVDVSGRQVMTSGVVKFQVQQTSIN